jgi:hypothetical protein
MLAICSLIAGLLLGLGAIIGWHRATATHVMHGSRTVRGSQTVHGRGPVRGFRAPLPSGATGGSVDSVACPSASACVGIGSYIDSSGHSSVLVVTGAGSSWKASGVRLPAGAHSVGYGPFTLACSTLSACVGVGSYIGPPGGQPQPLLVTESRGIWTAFKAPLPPDANATPSAALSAVACPSPSACVAVGGYSSITGQTEGVLITGAGISWTATESPTPAALNSVACESPSMCVAVGHDSSQGVLVTGSGTSWTAAPAPLPSNAAVSPDASLDAVACTAASGCVAAGYYGQSSGGQGGLLVTGTAASWTATEAPGSSALDQVACSPAGTCVAGGNSIPVLVTGSGTAWRAIPVPVPANTMKQHSGMVTFYSATCGPTSTCALAGEYTTTAKKQEGLIVSGSGSYWKAMEAPLPPDGSKSTSAGLQSAVCPLPATCVAGGSYNNYTLDQPLLEVYTLTHKASIKGHSTSGKPVPQTPELFVRTGYMLGSLYKYPHFPARIGLSNSDSIDGLHWERTGQDSITATGTLNHDSCNPDCADGNDISYTIEITASRPQHCILSVYPYPNPNSDPPHSVTANVFDNISIRTSNGNLPSYLAGHSAFSTPCK